MAAGLAGDQWNEGDVSCSVVRRVMLPDTFLAMDGLLETLLSVLDQMEIFDAVVATELNRYLPFLLTTTVMMEAVKKGAGREGAHEAIKEHAVAAIRDLRTGKIVQNDLLQRLAADQRLGLSEAELQSVLDHGRANSGDAGAQVDYFAEQVDALAKAKPEAASYQPGAIL
jgi:adenylosuccinate lyase